VQHGKIAKAHRHDSWQTPADPQFGPQKSPSVTHGGTRGDDMRDTASAHPDTTPNIFELLVRGAVGHCGERVHG